MTHTVYKAVGELLQAGEHAARATIIATTGFVPLPRHSTMFVTATGQRLGTVGHGDLDAAMQTAAQHVIETGQWRIEQYTVPEQAGVDYGWYSGWSVEVLLAPLTPQDYAIWHTIGELLNSGQRGTLATVLAEQSHALDGRRQLLMCDDGNRRGALGDVTLEAFVAQRGPEVWQAERSLLEKYQMTDGSTLQILLEPVLPSPTLYVFGGGQISVCLVHVATLAGFQTIVVDNQPDFANATRFPTARATMVMEFEQVKDTFDFRPDDYVVLMTRGHRHDQQLLEQLYDCPARYLGVLGSQRRIAAVWQRLEDKGIDRPYLERVRAPIGLAIGAASPEEIALSIITEIVRERRTGTVTTPRRQHRSALRP
jgi:xanthine dehydrogenase accessory factor